MHTTSSQSAKAKPMRFTSATRVRGAARRGVRFGYCAHSGPKKIFTKGMKYWLGAAGAYYGLLALGTHLVLH